MVGLLFYVPVYFMFQDESYGFFESPIVHCTNCENHQDFEDIFCKQINTFLGEGKTRFSVIHQNIRSYCKNFDQFIVFLESLRFKFNCIILTEAWLSNDSDLMPLEGYSLFRSYNSLNQCDGLVVYIDNSVSVTCSQLLLGGVATALSLTFDWAGTNCHLLAVYRSPSSNLLTFIDALDVYCNEYMNGNGLRILAGDINCDIYDVALNSVEQRYLDVLSGAGFLPCIDKVTRPESNTCIDHFFIKLPKVLHLFRSFKQRSYGSLCSVSKFTMYQW